MRDGGSRPLSVHPRSDASYGWAQKLLCGTPHIHQNREIWIYYNALRFRGMRELHKDIPDAYFEDHSALVMAKLRLDGFVSLDAAKEGTIVPQPFLAQGGQLFVNAGTVRAELLDAESGQPLRGFSLSEAAALQGDHLASRLGWQAQTALPQDRAVRVRFHLDQAQLYAFSVDSKV